LFRSLVAFGGYVFVVVFGFGCGFFVL